MKSALLIVDMQKGCKDQASKDSMDSATEYINYMSRVFRENNQPVVLIQDVEVGGGPGSSEFELLDEIEVSDRDIVIHKNYCNAFWKTELEKTLYDNGVEFVVVCGYSAEYCVLFTYNGGRERGFRTVLLQHGIASGDMNEVKSMQLKRPVISHEALEHFLKASEG